MPKANEAKRTKAVENSNEQHVQHVQHVQPQAKSKRKNRQEIKGKVQQTDKCKNEYKKTKNKQNKQVAKGARVRESPSGQTDH